jgi:hypothetical protein
VYFPIALESRLRSLSQEPVGARNSQCWRQLAVHMNAGDKTNNLPWSNRASSNRGFVRAIVLVLVVLILIFLFSAMAPSSSTAT